MLAAWLIFYRLAVTLAQTQIIPIDQTRELDFQIIGHVRDIMGHWRGEVVLPLNRFSQEPPELLTFRNLLSQLCTTLHPLCGLYDSEITKLRGLFDSTNRMQKEIKTILDNNKRRWQRSPAIIPDPFSDAHSYIAGSSMTITGSLERLMHDHPYGKFREIVFEGIQASLNASESFRDINFRLPDALQAARKKQTSENILNNMACQIILPQAKLDSQEDSCAVLKRLAQTIISSNETHLHVSITVPIYGNHAYTLFSAGLTPKSRVETEIRGYRKIIAIDC
ncbi:hypothetical protein QAD02_018004 [Eretmocerus hayati]|uniref:Uncharacterized protein n=1 Tax=Eretmocerus hayati TaxID=131215 RepID=A0ACC2PIH5_9HYME|nr:hypothetical protein QAD02_018004 [Eretmocerus hayati]